MTIPISVRVRSLALAPATERTCTSVRSVSWRLVLVVVGAVLLVHAVDVRTAAATTRGVLAAPAVVGLVVVRVFLFVLVDSGIIGEIPFVVDINTGGFCSGGEIGGDVLAEKLRCCHTAMFL